MTFFARLEKRARQIDSLLCIGLDPHIEELKSPTPEAALEFCQVLITETADLAAAFKPNSAFFEVFGTEGWRALKEVIRQVPAEIPVILDAKRGDIASTAQAYARAAFEELEAQAITLSPYLGRDSIEPFLSDPERGVFLLCKTSNPGAPDFQDLLVIDPETTDGERHHLRLFELVAKRAAEWNRRGNLGLVVGATQPEGLMRVRELAPEAWILAPGVGVQGGDLRMALQAGLRSDGLGLLLAVSRAISRQGDPRRAAEKIRLAIREGVAEYQQSASTFRNKMPGEKDDRALLAGQLLESSCVRFGRFTLKSGLVSPIYIDLRRLTGHPQLLASVAAAYRPLLRRLSFDRLAGIPYAALPIATAICLQSGWPLIYPRKEVKAYGTQAEIEGEYSPGEKAVVIDDLVTTGSSKFEAIERLTAAGLQIADVVVLIDRQSGAAERLAQTGYRLHAVFTLTQLLEIWLSSGSISAEQVQEVLDFLRDSPAKAD
jgi:uridine monophosphate synthetase